MILRKFSSWCMSGLALSLLAGSIPAAFAGGWDLVNAPDRLGHFDPHFDESGTVVPMTSHVPTNMMPYADTYWPSNRGGIAARWNASPWINPYLFDMAIHHRYNLPTAAEVAVMDDDAKAVLAMLEQMTPTERFSLIETGLSTLRYHSPTLEEAKSMSPEEIDKQLSPAEKYDLFRGKYEYPLTHEVLGAKNVGPLRSYWEGICHGWAPASVNHAEPKPVKMFNPDGIEVRFGSADVKALLDLMYAGRPSGVLGFLRVSGPTAAVNQMGYRCNVDLTKNPNAGGTRCGGVNAGSFHIAMTNYIGIQHRPFVADVAHGREIWNNPVYAYSYKIVGSQICQQPLKASVCAGADERTYRRVRLQTTIRYPSDDERLAPQYNPTIGKPEMLVPPTEGPINPAPFADTYRYEEGKYEYWLELDRDDNIVGGDWVSFDRPDYVWMMSKRPFAGEFEDLGKIYSPAF